MVILPSFSVIPKKTFLGLDKNSSHCFTLKKSLTEPFLDFFKLERGNLQQEIIFVTEGGEYGALLRLIIQDKSRPNKSGINRNWSDRLVINISWNGKKDTISMLQNNLVSSIRLVGSGLKNNRQIVNFEHLGKNRFYVSFSTMYI